MTRSIADILKDIETFHPEDDEWLPLDDLFEELWETGAPPQEAIPVLFRVFERFPNSDGAGVLWSIVHGIEGLPYNYEVALKQSYDRVPSEMAAIMLRRLAKANANG
jgi:hypothetical protein